jgi:hypothetical protein
MRKHAVGDAAGIYGYIECDGGLQGQSDEGVTALTMELHESWGYFHGAVVSSTGKGDTKPIFANTSGNAWTTDGAFMLNISKGTISGNILAPSQRLSLNATANIMETVFLNYLPVTTGCLPVSEAIGICDVAIPANTFTADQPQPVTILVRLVKINGVAKPFTVGSYVSVASNWFPEQAKLLDVVDHGDGTQSLTMNLRNPSGICIVFQNGIAGQYISFDSNTVRSSYFAFGSLTGSDLIYGVQIGGGVRSDFTLPIHGSEIATDDGGPKSGFHLFPGAEIVMNADQGFDCTLEQNPVLWEAGDVVENPHYPIFGGTALWITKDQTSPSHPSMGSGVMQLVGKGPGFGGGNTYIARLINQNPPEMYQSGGGSIVAPGGIEIQGPIRSMIESGCAPQNGGAVWRIWDHNGDPYAPVHIGDINYASGGNLFFYPKQGGVGEWFVDGTLHAQSGFVANHQPGVSGTLALADGKTAAVTLGLITHIA